MDTSKFHPLASEIAALASGMSRLEVQDEFGTLLEIVMSKKQKVAQQKEHINIINGAIKCLEGLKTVGPKLPEYQEMLKLSENARMELLEEEAKATSVLQTLQEEFNQSIKELEEALTSMNGQVADAKAD